MKSFFSIISAMFLLQTLATAQEKQPPVDITGMWKGYLMNDSTKKKIAYELAVSDEDGKLIGYSFTAFEDSGKREIGVKKMRYKRKGDRLAVEDVEMLTNTYAGGVPKGIHMKGEMGLTLSDTLMVYDGTWSTNPTKFYKPVTGSMHLERKRNLKESELYAKLQEMKLAKDLSFVRNPPQDVAKVTKPTPPPPPPVAVVEKKPEVKKEPAVKKPVKTVKPTPPPVVKSEPVKPVEVAPVIKEPAADVAKRKIANTQSVFYKSDSLTLTLYDNGEVDGDTVSVLMNGQLIFAKQGLSTKANSKTIQITKDTPDSLVLVMYAENLGSIPPNTGLLVVRDGETVYDVRFSADLNSNAEIILMRRKQGQ